MRFDSFAVAGFPEDLPVLFFVLGGVATLVGTAAWVSQEMADANEQSQLEALADRTLQQLLNAVHKEVSGTISVSQFNESRILAALASIDIGGPYLASVWMRYPEEACIASCASGEIESSHGAAYSSELINALDDGRIAVLEVALIVYMP